MNSRLGRRDGRHIGAGLTVDSGASDTGHDRLVALLAERDRLAREVRELTASPERLDVVIRDVRETLTHG